MKKFITGSAILMLALFGGCSSAEKPGPEKFSDPNILESSKKMRLYGSDYDTTFRAAVDALRLIDGSSAKLVKYDAGVILFKKPNDAGVLTARVKKRGEYRTEVEMSATNRRRFWLDGRDKSKMDAFFAELDKLLASTPSGEADTGMRKEKQPASSEGATSPQNEQGRDSLLAGVKETLQLDRGKKTFIDRLSYDDLSLLDQRLRLLDSASMNGKIAARKCAACYIDLARLYHDDAQYSRAADALRAAISVEPDNAVAHCNLGEIYKHQGLVDDAIRELNKAKILNPELPDIHINLGIMYDDYLNDDAKALEFYKKYLELGGADKQVLDWISAIEKGS